MNLRDELRDSFHVAVATTVLASVGLAYAVRLAASLAWNELARRAEPAAARREPWSALRTGICTAPGCAPDDGCELCRMFVCPSCHGLKSWGEGGCPDPRCDDCALNRGGLP